MSDNAGRGWSDAEFKLMEHIAESVDVLGKRMASLEVKVDDTRDRVMRSEEARGGARRDIDRLEKRLDHQIATCHEHETQLETRIKTLESVRDQAQGAVTFAGWVRQNIAWLVAGGAFLLNAWTNFGQ